MERMPRKRKQNKIKKRLVAASVLAVCILLMLSFAWYYYQSHRKIYSEEREVMPPYCLYLVEPNGTDSLNLTVGNLHPGEIKQIVVGVSNKAPTGETESFTIGKDSSFNYELEVAYTENLPVEYKVYELVKVEVGDGVESDEVSADGDGSDIESSTDNEDDASSEVSVVNDNSGDSSEVSAADEVTAGATASGDTASTQSGAVVTLEWETADANGSTSTVSQQFKKTLLNKSENSASITDKYNSEMYGDSTTSVVNLGQYDIYEEGSGASFDLMTKVNSDGTVEFDMDYYLIEIEWKDGITFSDYLKETDLVYVIVKALQLEPTEKQ